MKGTVCWFIYWQLVLLTMIFSINTCSVQYNHDEIIKELKQINSHLEKKNEQ